MPPQTDEMKKVQNEIFKDFISEMHPLPRFEYDRKVSMGNAEICLCFGIKKYPIADKLYPEAFFAVARDSEDELGVNFLEVARNNEVGPRLKVEKPTIINLGNILSQKPTDKLLFYLDSRYFFIAFCYALGFAKMLFVLPGVYYIANTLFVNSECLLNSNRPSICPQENNAYIFMTTLTLVVSLIVLAQVYDMTQAGASMIGNQNFEERAKFQWYLEAVDFRGWYGLLGLRCLCFLCLAIFSMYEIDGKRVRTDLVHFFTFPGSAFEFVTSLQATVYYLFALLFIMLVSNLSGSLCKSYHPWLRNVAKEKREGVTKNTYGILTKLATFFISCNTISFCFLISLCLRLLIDNIITLHVSNVVFYSVMIGVIFIVAWKYVNVCLTRRTSINIPRIFLLYSPALLFFGAVCGLEYQDDKLIPPILIYGILSLICANILYLAIAFFIKSCISAVDSTRKLYFTRQMVGLNLSLVAIILALFAVRNMANGFTDQWFNFSYIYSFVPTGYVPALEQLPALSTTSIALQIQRVFMVVPLATVLFTAVDVFFDRKFLLFRKGRFWLSLLLAGLNLSNLCGILFVERMLDRLQRTGYAAVDYLEDDMDHLRAALVFVLVAMAALAGSAIIAVAHFNMAFAPVRNPTFDGEEGERPSFDREKIDKPPKRLSMKLPEKLKPTVATSVAFLAVYAPLLIYLLKTAFEEEWIVVVANLHHPLNNIVHGPTGDAPCPSAAYASAATIVNPLLAALGKASGLVAEISLVDQGDKGLLLYGVPFSWLVAVLSFALYVVDPTLIDPYAALLWSNAFYLPGLLFVVFAPALCEIAAISLVMEVRLKKGLFAAMAMYFAHLGFTLLMMLEALPIGWIYAGGAGGDGGEEE